MSKLIVGNLKMHMEHPSQRDEYCRVLAGEVARLRASHTIVVCPPPVHVEYFCRALRETSVTVGGQDCFWEYYGGYTGNTSPKVLAAFGATHVIVGHSERRQYNHETNDDVARKVLAALRARLIPIVCVGFMEAADEMDSIRLQVEAVTNACDAELVRRVVFAYEPVWAIGSGRTPTRDEIQTMTVFVRSLVAQRIGKDAARRMRILYGGSVTPENAREVCVAAFTDGVLVGKASLSPAHFVAIARMVT